MISKHIDPQRALRVLGGGETVRAYIACALIKHIDADILSLCERLHTHMHTHTQLCRYGLAIGVLTVFLCGIVFTCYRMLCECALSPSSSARSHTTTLDAGFKTHSHAHVRTFITSRPPDNKPPRNGRS